MEWIGWASSFILVLTLIRQVTKQWTAGTSEGVSLWFYIGQISAQVGFVTYSVLIKNWVFIFTNSVLLGVSFTGLSLLLYHRRNGA